MRQNPIIVEASKTADYRNTRDRYAHVLSTFSQSGYNDTTRQCLAAFVRVG